MRRRHCSHPQPSSGYVCRDKRWSGLIRLSHTTSSHLWPSYQHNGNILTWADPRIPPLSQLSIVWAEHLRGKSNYNISASDRQCIGEITYWVSHIPEFIKWIMCCKSLADLRTKCAKQDESFLPYKPIAALTGRLKQSHCWTPILHPPLPQCPHLSSETLLSDAHESQQERAAQLLLPAWLPARTGVLVIYTVCKYRLKRKHRPNHKQVVLKVEFMIVTSISTGIPKTH